MLKIVSLFLLIVVIEVSLYISIFHVSILDKGILNLVVYKEYINEYLVLSLLFILFYGRQKFLNFILIVLSIFIFIIDIIQFLSYYYTDSFLTIDAFDNLSQILLFLNKTTIVSSMIFIIFILIFIYFLMKVKIKDRLFSFMIILVLTTFNFYFYYLNKDKNDIFDEYNIEKGPVLNFIKVVKTYFTPLQIKNVKLTQKEKEFAVKHNLIHNLNSKYPLEKNYFYNKKLLDNNLSNKPNIIVFFIESLSAKYVDVYNSNNKKITPNIDKLAKNSIIVRNYINHSFPTIRGLYGQLCSLYPEFRVRDIVDNYKSYHFYNKKCLPSYLNNYNYHTVYLNHGNEARQRIKYLAKSYGFLEMLFNRDIEKLIQEKPKHSLDSDMSDQQMAKAVIKYLKNYKQNKPLFMAISTIESHVGESLADDAVINKKLNDVENSYYNVDNALGKIFKYIKNSKYNKNTIIIVTGDHVRMEQYKKYNNSKIYGDLALVIYSPFIKHKNIYANSSSIDLAPTILHLINYPNKKNSFLGKSIFENDSNIAIGVTRDYGMFYSIYRDKKVVEAEQFSKPNNENSKMIYDILNYIFMLSSQNRIYK